MDFDLKLTLCLNSIYREKYVGRKMVFARVGNVHIIQIVVELRVLTVDADRSVTPQTHARMVKVAKTINAFIAPGIAIVGK